MDLGREDDFTCWAITETVVVPTGRVETVAEPAILAAFRHGRDARPQTYERAETRVEHRLRHLERVRGVSYVRVAERTGDVLRQLVALAKTETPPPVDPLFGRSADPPTPTLAVDGTGVGAPVVDLLRAAELPAWVRPVLITGGDAASRDGAGFRVPKRDLAAALAVVLEGERLKWPPRLALRRVLESELRSFRVTVGAAGHDRYGAAGQGDGWRERPHDDAVLAVALAVWVAEFAEGVAVAPVD